MAHQLDCEDTQRPATQQIMRDYVTAMQDHLGRHIVLYTGDWWWQPRGWDGASLTPYVWAAPNAGYLSAYPGDTSSYWRAGYGGWGDYAILQYAVSPISGAGGGNISKSAIRDSRVWAALTGTAIKEDGMAFADDMLAWGGADSGPKVLPEYQMGGKRQGNSGVEQLAEIRGEIAKLRAQPPAGTVEITDEQLERVLRRILGMAPATPAT